MFQCVLFLTYSPLLKGLPSYCPTVLFTKFLQKLLHCIFMHQEVHHLEFDIIAAEEVITELRCRRVVVA